MKEYPTTMRSSKLFEIISLIVIFFVVTSANNCPSSTKVLNCTPKCLQDSECSAIGGKCCPNLCNQRSCVQRNQLDSSGSNSSPFNKNSATSGASGSYCGNVKCGAFEKCEMDRSTKQPKCVRS